MPPLPRYGSASLSDLLPSLLAATGVDGLPDALELAERRAGVAVLLLVDGLGADLLAAHAADAPFLAAAWSGRRLSTGYPSTTAASITSLGTGRPPGEHGIVGYRMALPDGAAVLNTLRWKVEGDAAPPPDPLVLQPHQTLPQALATRAPAALVAPAEHEGSGLTVAAWRGTRFIPANHPDEVVAGAAAAATWARLVIAYHGEVDRVGHVTGPGSAEWRAALADADRLAERLAAELPPGALLAVTGDHGMVTVDEPDRVDYDALPELAAGVRLLAGEPRARHIHTVPGAGPDVLAAWQAVLGDRMWVLSGAEAIAAGWFGPTVSAAAAASIGDVIAAAADGDVAVVRRVRQPKEAALAGHHGSLTRAELEVPLVLAG